METFGRLTIIEIIGKSKHGDHICKCKCICGTEKNILLSNLKKGATRSCGCLFREKNISSGLRLARQRHSNRVWELNGTRFKSSYEYVYARHLIRKNIDWFYEWKTFNLSDCTYTPDFYLPVKKEYIEVKGYFYPNSKNKILKLENELGIKVKIILRDDILKLEPNLKELIDSNPIKADEKNKWINIKLIQKK